MKKIPLSAKNNIKNKRQICAIVDDDDYEYLIKFNWQISKNNYATRKIKKNELTEKYAAKMHNIITGFKFVDHIDGNGLNNQKSNLRESCPKTNQMNRRMLKKNSSGYKGVTKELKRKRYRATISVDRKNVYLGSFLCKHEAAKAYNDAAIKYFGDFARLNIIPTNT